jgi:autotransporter-associated beta strand protein
MSPFNQNFCCSVSSALMSFKQKSLTGKFRHLLPGGLIPLIFLAFASPTFADTRTWIGGGTNPNSGNGGNWLEGTPSTDTSYHVVYNPENLVSPFRDMTRYNTADFGFLSLSLAGNVDYPGFIFTNSPTPSPTTLNGDVTATSGIHKFNINTTVAVDSTWNIASGAEISFGGADNMTLASNRKITKIGDGTLFFESSQTGLEGTVQLNQGTILAQNQAGMGSANLVLNSGALVLQRNLNSNYGNNVTIGGSTTVVSQRATEAGNGVTQLLGSLGIGEHTLTVSTGTNGLTTGGTAAITFGATTLSGNATFHVENNVENVSTRLNLGAVAGDGYGFTKSGSGVLVLEDINTYTGNTTVTGGGLIVSGSVHADSAVSVGSGASIGGAGSILGDLTLDSGAMFVWNNTGALTVAGTVTLGNSFGVDNLLGVDWGSLDINTPYTLIQNTSGSFSNINHFGEENKFEVGDGLFAYFQDGSLQVVVIPEPGFLPLSVFVLVAVLFMRRRK